MEYIWLVADEDMHFSDALVAVFDEMVTQGAWEKLVHLPLTL